MPQNMTFKPGQGWVQALPDQEQMSGFQTGLMQNSQVHQAQAQHMGQRNEMLTDEARQNATMQQRQTEANTRADSLRKQQQDREDSLYNQRDSADQQRKNNQRMFIEDMYRRYGQDDTSSGDMGGGAGKVPGPIKAPDTSAASAAAFARAKDQVGQIARGAVTGLRSTMGASGRGQSRPMSNAINHGVGQLGEVSRDQAIKDADLAEQNELARYNGEVTMRGQDVAAQNARYQSRQSHIDALLGAVKGLY